MSKRQELIERIRQKEKIVEIGLNCLCFGNSRPICARCLKSLTLWLDEIKGRHAVGESFPSSVRPTNHQLLCEDCHRVKTEGLEFGKHFDYVSKNQPRFKIYLVTFEQEIRYRLPNFKGTQLKQNLNDVLKAVTSASKVMNYVSIN